MGTSNYRLMTQLPTANLTNWVEILRISLAVIRVKCFHEIHRVTLDNTIFFLLKMVVEGVYSNNLMGATLTPLAFFFFFFNPVTMTNLVCNLNMSGIILNLMNIIKQICGSKDIKTNTSNLNVT